MNRIKARMKRMNNDACTAASLNFPGVEGIRCDLPLSTLRLREVPTKVNPS